MNRRKNLLSFLLLGGCVLMVAMFLVSCGDEVQNLELQQGSEIHEINGAITCDVNGSTPSLTDDCNGTSAGYFYNPSTYYTYYRSSDGVVTNVARERFFTTSVGSPVRLSSAVVTNQVGVPLTSENGKTISRPLSSGEKIGKINTSPVRSTANFSHPSLGRVSGGKTTSVSRGVSFGGRSGGFSG